ncbi:4a-hydroxytetrahydrobiopterin dehydratase [Acidocella sp.]|uniref:4a-hydroxytetrahydrobiopterin dehydratase n=1 Tax=Acidocella sp. TaxID=50710 RepID=UPI003D01053B
MTQNQTTTPPLKSPPGWQWAPDGKSITRTVTFKNFTEAFSFMTYVALLAEKADHHPDWSNTYNKVSISLSTHSAGAVTEKDMQLARAINDFIPNQE